MKQHLITAMALGITVASVTAADKPDLKNPTAKASYAIGMDIGSNFKKQEVEIDGAALAAGLVDGLAGKGQLTEAEAKEALDGFRTTMMAKMQDKQKSVGAKNETDGAVFLAANAKKAGVKTTATGLQYKVIKSGPATGKSPKATDTVKAHYHGTLIDGTVFDSSVTRGEPLQIPVNRVIPGWTEALQLMKEGDKWQIYVPGKLAYGERGAGGQIGPNATLIFDVELITIEKAN